MAQGFLVDCRYEKPVIIQSFYQQFPVPLTQQEAQLRQVRK